VRPGRSGLAAVLLALCACGDRAAPGNDVAVPGLERVETAVVAPETPVRIGEGGPAFRACQAAGMPRDPDPAAALPVRAAPFEGAPTTTRIAAGTRFFVCSRSIDQRWLGVVFEDGGTLSPGCGVSRPVPQPAAYTGPCRSGWVASAAVRSIAD